MIAALDIETTGLSSWTDKVLGIGIYCKDYEIYFTDLYKFSLFIKDNPTLKFVMHNGSFDVNFLRRNNIDLRDMWFYDTRTIASIIYPWASIQPGQKSQFSLENLYLNHIPGAKVYKLDRTNMTSYTTEEVETYCLKDCKITYDLFFKFLDMITEQSGDAGWEFVDNWIMPATKAAAEMEYNGISIDLPALLTFRKECEKDLERSHRELLEVSKEARSDYSALIRRGIIREYERKKTLFIQNHLKADVARTNQRYGNLQQKALSRVPIFNFSSSAQLIWLLKREGLNVVDPMTNKESTGKAVLKNLEMTGNPIATALLAYKKAEKLLNSNIPNLIDNIKPDGRVHGRLNVGGTRTGRLSSSQPNMQQCSKGKLRECITARDDNHILFCADYSQLEVRIIAELSKEEALVNAFKAGIDPYSVFAKSMFSLDTPVERIKDEHPEYRDAGKVGVLSMLYRTGAKKLRHSIAKSLGREVSLKECQEYIANFKAGMQTLQGYDQELAYQLANQKITYNLMGRPFQIQRNDDIYMLGLNTMVQGSASDLVVHGQVNGVYPALQKAGAWYEPKLWVHDEVIIELRKDEAEQIASELIVPNMSNLLQKSLGLDVPLTLGVSLSNSWEKK